MDEKNNNLTSNGKAERRTSSDSPPKKKKESLVTVYLNYTGDNSGVVLNPQKFRFLMPSVFGPGDFSLVLTSIFDSCIKCAFQPTSFNQRIRELFPSPEENKKSSFTSIKRKIEKKDCPERRSTSCCSSGERHGPCHSSAGHLRTLLGRRPLVGRRDSRRLWSVHRDTAADPESK